LNKNGKGIKHFRKQKRKEEINSKMKRASGKPSGPDQEAAHGPLGVKTRNGIPPLSYPL
jgi:hypothetical protein